MRYLTACTLGLAFGAGLVGTGALGVVVVAPATFVLAFAHGHAPWRWATLSLAAWATGVGLGFLPMLLKDGGAGVTVAVVYASAFAAAGVNWGAPAGATAIDSGRPDDDGVYPCAPSRGRV